MEVEIEDEEKERRAGEGRRAGGGGGGGGGGKRNCMKVMEEQTFLLVFTGGCVFPDCSEKTASREEEKKFKSR